MYKYTAEADQKNRFNLDKYLKEQSKQQMKLSLDEEYEVIDLREM